MHTYIQIYINIYILIRIAPYMGLNFALFETFKVVVDAITASVRMRIGEFNNRLSKRDASEQLPLPSVVRNGLSGTALYVCMYVYIIYM